MCFLTVRASTQEHAGDWHCQLEGECSEEDFSPVDWPQDDDAFVGRKRRTAERRKEKRRVKRQTVRRLESCDNTAVKGVRVKVVAKEELSVLPAQDTYHANLDSLVVLTARTNEPFDRCRVSQGRQERVEISGGARREECVSVGRDGAQVCASVTKGVPSCLLTIDKVTPELAGSWSFEIEREVGQSGRTRTLRQTARADLILVEFPSLLYIKYDGVEYRGDSDDIIVAKVGDRALFQCIAQGGVPRPQVELFLGSQNSSGVERSCRAPNRDSLCRGFEVELAPEHDSAIVSCVARMPGVDKEDNRSGSASQLVYNGLEAGVRLSLGYQARLISPASEQDKTSVLICDTGLCRGQDFQMAIQFEASPEPSQVEWVMRANDGRRKTIVRAGDRRAGYDAERLEDISSRRQPDRFEARLLLEEVEEEDLAVRAEHQLRVTNSAGTTTFLVSVDQGRACRCQVGGGSANCTGRNCNQGQTSSSGSPSPLEPLLSSCLALGSSLLSTHSPEGSPRPSSQSERQFEASVEDFYREASCAGYGRNILELYQLKKQGQGPQEPLTLGPGGAETIFTKLDPTGGVKVLRTKALHKEKEEMTTDVLGAAREVLAQGESLEAQEKTEVNDEKDKPVEEAEMSRR